MKLWTTWDLTQMPAVQREGLTNPTYSEIIFSNSAELVADEALSFEGELAFIEVDFPDDEIEEWLAYCIGSVGDDHTNMEMDLQYDLDAERLSEEEIEERAEFLERMERIESATQNLELLGYACLAREVPPEMIRVLDPLTMLQAVATDDKELLAEAVKTAESSPIQQFGAAFWAFIASILTAIFATGTISEGLEMAYGLRDLIQKSREARERRKARAAGKKGRRRRRGKSGGRKSRGSSLAGPYRFIEIRPIETPFGQMAYAMLPVPGHKGPRGPVQIYLRAGEEDAWMYLKDAPDEFVGAEEAEAAIRDAVRRMASGQIDT